MCGSQESVSNGVEFVGSSYLTDLTMSSSDTMGRGCLSRTTLNIVKGLETHAFISDGLTCFPFLQSTIVSSFRALGCVPYKSTYQALG